MIEARTRRLVLCLLMSAFALGSVTRVDANQIVFANGRSIAVKDYRIAGNVITVTFPNGGEASFDASIVAEIRAAEMPDEPPAVPFETSEWRLASAFARTTDRVRPPLDARPFATLIETVALKHGVDPELVHAVVETESNYRPRAKSHVGARGLMQLMPETAKDLGLSIRDLYDPEKNLEAGVRYLKWLQARFDGNLKQTLAAYNAGPGAVRKYRGIPPYQETRQYVKKVLTNFYD